jgi:hypothetical protein
MCLHKSNELNLLNHMNNLHTSFHFPFCFAAARHNLAIQTFSHTFHFSLIQLLQISQCSETHFRYAKRTCVSIYYYHSSKFLSHELFSLVIESITHTQTLSIINTNYIEIVRIYNKKRTDINHLRCFENRSHIIQ